MSEFDENGRRMPDYDELQDAADARQARRQSRCLCLPNEWPGSCPGPLNCPVHGENLSDRAED